MKARAAGGPPRHRARCRKPASDRRSRSWPTPTRRSAHRSARRSSGALAPEHDAVLVLECARANGDIVSARKGIADYARHDHRPRGPRRRRAGEGPLRHPRGGAPGRSPSTRSTADGRRSPSTRASSTAARGRTSCRGALRAPGGPAGGHASTPSRPRRPRSSASRPSPTVDGVTVALSRTAGHPPMEKTDASARLVGLAVEIAGELGFELRDAATGGASDANTTAALGHPDPRRPRADRRRRPLGRRVARPRQRRAADDAPGGPHRRIGEAL